jgi:hypothetical protein
MAKPTLSVDRAVVERAKRFAESRGTSVSALIERYLDLLTRELPGGEDPPVLARLRGVLRNGDSEAFRRHLEDKYLR